MSGTLRPSGVPMVGTVPPQGPVAGTMQYGLMRAASVTTLMEEARRKAAEAQNQPLISGLSGHVRAAWTVARTAKQQSVEPRMLASLRARRGEYEADKLAQIREMGGSEVFVMLTSVKCRGASSWLRDVLLGSGSEKPWTLRPTPVPDLPPQVGDAIVAAAAQQIQTAEMGGQPMDEAMVLELVQSLHSQAQERAREFARKACERMEAKMEDQLVEGGFLQAMDSWIDDLTTFPAAILKGPVVRRRPKLQWSQGPGGNMIPQVQDALVLEWERVNPFNFYPSPSATTVDNGFMIERHRLQPSDLEALIGVEGYDDSSIRMVLEEYGRGGLREWLTNDVAQANAAGVPTTAVSQNPDHLIDALQYWGQVQGQLLLDWGMDRETVADPTKNYHVECWLIGRYVIKAVLNYDPLHRKPYYKASYEEIPGSFWGNSVADLVRDTQGVTNAAARALVNNMGMASGPQVGINIDQLPEGEDITTLTPWKIWQFRTNPAAATQSPITFFQPTSNVQDLMLVFEKFLTMADDFSGIPRYMTGDAKSGGAGRTASGLSMLMGNAGKGIKQVIAAIDTGLLTPMLERLYVHNMRYAEDPDLKGDAEIVARGASSLVAKETAQVRRNEFLATTANPVDMQIVGIEGRAELLRESAKGLDVDPDKIVPPTDVLRQRLAAQAMMAAGGGAPMGAGSPPSPPALAAPPPKSGPSDSGQALMDGAPQTDNFSPPRAPTQGAPA